MDGRISTPPTTPGVQKRAGQGKAEGTSRPSKAKSDSSQTCGVQRLPRQALEKHPVNAYGGSTTARHGRKGCDRQERMIRADFIPALCWDWPIMPGIIMQGRPEGGGSFGNGLLHCRPRRSVKVYGVQGANHPPRKMEFSRPTFEWKLGRLTYRSTESLSTLRHGKKHLLILASPSIRTRRESSMLGTRYPHSNVCVLSVSNCYKLLTLQAVQARIHQPVRPRNTSPPGGAPLLMRLLSPSQARLRQKLRCVCAEINFMASVRPQL
jgi:hypothetical protein